ncbi:MAG: hypothetical protein PHN19_02490 [Patescibacteria group bacterium]|nr:hypothetical protein [Patescibacteria group bacterium]
MARRNIDVPDQEEFYKEQAKSGKRTRKRKGVVVEDAPTIAEVDVPTVAEEAAPTVKEASTVKELEVADKDIQEVDENGKKKSSATGVKKEHKVTEVEEGEATEEEKAFLERAKFEEVEAPPSPLEMEGEDILAQIAEEIRKNEGRGGVKTAEVEEVLKTAEEEVYDNPEVENLFAKYWPEDSFSQTVDNLIGNTDTSFDEDTNLLVSDVEKNFDAQTVADAKIWNVEQGRQTVEKLTKYAKKGLSNAGGLLKGLFSGRIKNGLSMFGRTMRDLGYGTVAAGENLPKLAIKKMDDGLRDISTEAQKAYEEIAKDFPAEIKRTKEKIKAWEEKRKEKSERKEYEKLLKQRERFEQLRAKFEVSPSE